MPIYVHVAISPTVMHECIESIAKIMTNFNDHKHSQDFLGRLLDIATDLDIEVLQYISVSSEYFII